MDSIHNESTGPSNTTHYSLGLKSLAKFLNIKATIPFDHSLVD